MEIGYQQGLWAFLILIPFIILYLIRPKLVKMKIPSLMFLMGDEKSKKQLSFLRKFLRDPLFFLQLLLLLALAFSIAQPNIFLPKAETATNTVVIIDGSASSQVEFNGKSRFEDSVAQSKQYLDGRVSVILAAQIPEILIEDVGRTRAWNVLKTVSPRDTTTNIAGGMYMAKDILQGRKGQVIILSDFLLTNEEDNVLVAKRALNANNIAVRFLSTNTIVENMGIIDLEPTRDSVKATVKNYGSDTKEIEMQLVKDDEVKQSQKIKVASQSIENIAFPTLPGVSQIKLNAKDNFLLDNVAHISSPLSDKIKVLMISNNKDNFIKKAMEAANIFEIELRQPPIVKAFDLTHDLIIITDVSKTIVPSDIVDLKKYVESGKIMIIAANSQLLNLGLGELLPIVGEKLSESTPINVKIINEFTKDKDFGNTRKHIVGKPKDGTIVFAVSDTDSPLMAEKKLEEGKVFYYGILDEESEFKATEDYPIFWFTLLTSLLNTEDIRNYNFKLSEKVGRSKVGVVEEEGKTIALNLLNEKESDVSRKSTLLEQDSESFKEKEFKGKARFELAIPLLILGVLLILLELLYLKWRGDL